MKYNSMDVLVHLDVSEFDFSAENILQSSIWIIFPPIILSAIDKHPG